MSECPNCNGDGNVCDLCSGNRTGCLEECACGREFCSLPSWPGSEPLAEALRGDLGGQTCYERHVEVCKVLAERNGAAASAAGANGGCR